MTRRSMLALSPAALVPTAVAASARPAAPAPVREVHRISLANGATALVEFIHHEPGDSHRPPLLRLNATVKLADGSDRATAQVVFDGPADYDDTRVGWGSSPEAGHAGWSERKMIHNFDVMMRCFG